MGAELAVLNIFVGSVLCFTARAVGLLGSCLAVVGFGYVKYWVIFHVLKELLIDAFGVISYLYHESHRPVDHLVQNSSSSVGLRLLLVVVKRVVEALLANAVFEEV